MLNLLTGCLLLSLLHAAIPNHWAPVLAVARAERWSLRRAVGVTLVAGLAHVLSTVLLGIGLGLLGWQLSAQFSRFAGVAAPTLLVLIGMLYALSGPGHTHPDPAPVRPRGRVVLGLAATMFLAPCLEIQTFFLAAGAHGPLTLASLMAYYLVVSVGAMSALVAAAYTGLRRLNLAGLVHYERRLTGAVLVLVGLAGFFVDW
jgi:nickel/cobalt transporter (NicO) family protein